jgi:hypothetical protein
MKLRGFFRDIGREKELQLGGGDWKDGTLLNGVYGMDIFYLRWRLLGLIASNRTFLLLFRCYD